MPRGTPGHQPVPGDSSVEQAWLDARGVITARPDGGARLTGTATIPA
jgi:hypothetical protein